MERDDRREKALAQGRRSKAEQERREARQVKIALKMKAWGGGR